MSRCAEAAKSLHAFTKSLFALYEIVDTSFQDSILFLGATVTRLENLDGRHLVRSAHTDVHWLRSCMN